MDSDEEEIARIFSLVSLSLGGLGVGDSCPIILLPGQAEKAKTTVMTGVWSRGGLGQEAIHDQNLGRIGGSLEIGLHGFWGWSQLNETDTTRVVLKNGLDEIPLCQLGVLTPFVSSSYRRV